MMKIEVPKGRTAVAVSGGADSVALLRLLLDAGADLVALHCNFHLRGEESDRDERFVSDLCKRLGVELHVEHFDTLTYSHERGISTEMAARELRYEWFERMLAQLHCDQIAVAHHSQDQAETVLLNLLRGTGLRGLVGMRHRNGHIVRPLLHVSKQDILDYLSGIGQDYMEDSTNAERDALRNRLRLDVIPLLRDINPKAVEHICNMAELVASYLDTPPEGGYTLHSLHEWLQPYGFNSAQIRAVLREMNGPSGAIYESPTHRLLRDRGKLLLTEKGQADLPALRQCLMETSAPLDFLKEHPLTPDHAYLDADLLSLPLRHRLCQTGDRFHPFGMKGSRLVSDFLTDLKVNRFEKERQTVLLSGTDIVWVVGRRTDDRYRVTSVTRRICCVTINATK